MSSEDSASGSIHDDDLDVHDVNTGAEEKSAIPVNKLRKGGYCLIENRPCRVVDIAKSKTGKHGHAKASIAGTDLFTGRRYETHLPTSHEIEVPKVERNDYELINIDENHTQLLDLNGNMREDVDLRENDDASQRVKAAYEEDPNTPIIVTVLSSLGESIIVDFKRNTSQQQQEQEQEQE